MCAAPNQEIDLVGHGVVPTQAGCLHHTKAVRNQQSNNLDIEIQPCSEPCATYCI
jgi:hypothetical protein